MSGMALRVQLGGSSDAERHAFERHVSEGCAACQLEVSRAGVAMSELQGSGEPGSNTNTLPEASATLGMNGRAGDLSERLLRELPSQGEAPANTDRPGDIAWKRWSPAEGAREDAVAGPGLFTRMAAEGEWEATDIAGIRAKALRVDSERRSVTMLVTMEPGSAYPRHRHAGAEECFVLQGDLQVGGRSLGPGDYQCAEAGTVHDVQSTREGCTLLLVSSQDDVRF